MLSRTASADHHRSSTDERENEEHRPAQKSNARRRPEVIGICTLDEARRRRNAILNFSVLALILGIGIYIFWTYIILHYWGIAVGLPWSGYDESWATPAAILAFSSALLVYMARRFSARRREAVRSRP